MKKYLFPLLAGSFLCIMLFCAFFLFNRQSEMNEKKRANTGKSKSLIIGDPIDYVNSPVMIFPVGTYEGPRVFKDKLTGKDISSANKVGFFSARDISSNGTVAYEYSNTCADIYDEKPKDIANDQVNTDVQNLIFYNRKTNEKYYLSDSALHITNFSFKTNFQKELIMYKIIKSDYNGDSLFTNTDGVVLYMSDKEGKNFLQLSPDSAQYLEYTYYQDVNMLLVKSMVDKNKDKKFDMNDEFMYTKVSLSSPNKGVDIFGKSFTDSLKNMMIQ